MPKIRKEGPVSVVTYEDPDVADHLPSSQAELEHGFVRAPAAIPADGDTAGEETAEHDSSLALDTAKRDEQSAPGGARQSQAPTPPDRATAGPARRAGGR